MTCLQYAHDIEACFCGSRRDVVHAVMLLVMSIPTAKQQQESIVCNVVAYSRVSAKAVDCVPLSKLLHLLPVSLRSEQKGRYAHVNLARLVVQVRKSSLPRKPAAACVRSNEQTSYTTRSGMCTIGNCSLNGFCLS